MDVVIVPIFNVLLVLLKAYSWALIVYAVMSWLLLFGVINRTNQLVYLVLDFLQRIIEPALTPIRRIIPSVSGLDLSLFVLLLSIYFLEMVITRLLFKLL